MDTYTAEQALPAERGRPARRLRTAEEKTRIVQQTLVPGASVAEVARRHGVNANLLFTWRRLYRQGVLEQHTRPPKAAAKLLPIKVKEPVAAAGSTPSPGTIEIEWPDKVRVRVVGEVSAEQLSAVLGTLAQHR